MKQQDILFLVISSVILVVVWITFSILHASLTSTITESVGKELIPIQGTFDTKVIADLKNRQGITPVSVIATTPSVTPTPTQPPITPIAPLASSSATVATQGGTQ